MLKAEPDLPEAADLLVATAKLLLELEWKQTLQHTPELDKALRPESKDYATSVLQAKACIVQWSDESLPSVTYANGIV